MIRGDALSVGDLSDIMAPREGGSAFVGALDNLPSTTAAYAVRRLLTSYVANKAINIRSTNDNATTDIGFTASGDLDSGAISSFLTTHGGNAAVTKWYDQSGNANDAAQVNAADQAIATSAQFGSIYGLVFSAPATGYLSGNITVSQPYTAAAVAHRTGNNTTLQDFFGTTLITFLMRFNNAVNTFVGYAGTVLSATAADANAHSLIVVYNNTSGSVTVDGTTTSGTIGTGAPSGTPLNIGENAGTGATLTGVMGEVMLFPSGLSAANISTLAANQKSYYGTP